ncbi:MAG: DUF4405 domain-containing protein [Methylomonas sp.]|nr:DUF4405 domain-containing protein [Methylomonas sp.]
MSTNRTVVNIIIDLIATVLFLGMLATGYLLRFPLPPGSNKSHVLWGLSRHEWGDVHFWISVGLMLVLVVHLALHWNWVVTVIGKRCGLVKSPQPSLVRSAAWVIGVFAAICFGFAWLAERDVVQIDRPWRSFQVKGRQTIEQQQPAMAEAAEALSGRLFWDDVSPIFQQHCVACHGPDKQWADFRADQRQDFFKSGAPLILPGQSAQSPLLAIISGARNDMPVAEGHRLAEADMAIIKAWIEQGAK